VLYLIFIAVFLILWGMFYAAMPALEHAKRFAARAVTRLSTRFSRVGHYANRFRSYVPLALIVILGGFAVAWFGDQFMDLAELLHANSPKLQDFDALAHAWAVSKRSASFTSFFITMTDVGSPGGMGALAGIVAVVLLVRRRFRWVGYLLVTAGGGALLNLELKQYFARARPALADMLKRAHGSSFPSGHAMGSTVVLLALSYLAARTTTQWRWKAACLALAWALIFAVSISRVYLGAHWISDVAAGISAGALWTGITTIAYETARRIRMLRSVRVSGS